MRRRTAGPHFHNNQPPAPERAASAAAHRGTLRSPAPARPLPPPRGEPHFKSFLETAGAGGSWEPPRTSLALEGGGVGGEGKGGETVMRGRCAHASQAQRRGAEEGNGGSEGPSHSGPAATLGVGSLISPTSRWGAEAQRHLVCSPVVSGWQDPF